MLVEGFVALAWPYFRQSLWWIDLYDGGSSLCFRGKGMADDKWPSSRPDGRKGGGNGDGGGGGDMATAQIENRMHSQKGGGGGVKPIHGINVRATSSLTILI